MSDQVLIVILKGSMAQLYVLYATLYIIRGRTHNKALLTIIILEIVVQPIDGGLLHKDNCIWSLVLTVLSKQAVAAHAIICSYRAISPQSTKYTT